MTNEEIIDELHRMLSDCMSGFPLRDEAQKTRYREAVKEVSEILENVNTETTSLDCIDRHRAMQIATLAVGKLNTPEDKKVICKRIVAQMKKIPSVVPSK